MLSTEEIDKIFRASTTEARDKLAQLQHNLKFLIASEVSVEDTFKDVNLPIQELQTTFAEISNIISKIDLDDTESQTIKLNANKFYKITKFLKNLSDRYQKFYSNNLINLLLFNATSFEGLSKLYEIRYFIKTQENTSTLDFAIWLNFYNSLVDFLDNFSESQPKGAILMGKIATELVELNKTILTIEQWLSLPKSTRETYLNQLSQELGYPVSEELYINCRKAEDKFIKTALATSERIEASRKGSSLLPYMTNLGRTREEQIQKNQKALALIQSWIDEEVSEEELEKSRETWERVKKIIDEQRPPGQKLFSQE